MNNTFKNLITQKLKNIAEGDPFDVLPIKNAKRAFECEEVHLADRGIERLVKFDKFPNLEVLWINGNKVKTKFSDRIALRDPRPRSQLQNQTAHGTRERAHHSRRQSFRHVAH
jgi:hypothetical protein